MAQPPTQTFENHARIIPAYHMVAFGILVINLFWSLYRLVRVTSGDQVMAFLVSVALIIMFFYARIFALTVQDRVIRLEMTLRLQQLLPPELRPRIKDFNVGQLVALRFASDEELPELAKQVLADNLSDRKAIKKMIRNWQADYLRA